MEETFITGTWTLYYHASREKRWTLDSFEKIATVIDMKKKGTSIEDAVMKIFKKEEAEVEKAPGMPEQPEAPEGMQQGAPPQPAPAGPEGVLTGASAAEQDPLEGDDGEALEEKGGEGDEGGCEGGGQWGEICE